MAVHSTPSSWASMPTVLIIGTDSPKLIYNPTTILDTLNEWHKAVTITLSGHNGCHAVLEGWLMYATLAAKYAELKAASMPHLDNYQVGDTKVKTGTLLSSSTMIARLGTTKPLTGYTRHCVVLWTSRTGKPYKLSACLHHTAMPVLMLCSRMQPYCQVW